MAVCLHIHDWLCWEFLGLTLVSRSPLASSFPPHPPRSARVILELLCCTTSATISAPCLVRLPFSLQPLDSWTS